MKCDLQSVQLAALLGCDSAKTKIIRAPPSQVGGVRVEARASFSGDTGKQVGAIKRAEFHSAPVMAAQEGGGSTMPEESHYGRGRRRSGSGRGLESFWRCQPTSSTSFSTGRFFGFLFPVSVRRSWPTFHVLLAALRIDRPVSSPSQSRAAELNKKPRESDFFPAVGRIPTPSDI